MSELIPPPSEWKFRLNLDAATLTSQLGKHRLLCLKAYLAGNKRVYSAVSIKDGQGNAWNGKVTKADLKTTLGQESRLTALDCFEEKKKTFCAAAWVDNPTAIWWNWDIDLTASQLNARLKKDDGKLISIRAYKTTLGGELRSPQTRYCAIWIKNDGVKWDWLPDALADSIADTLDLESARIVSIDNLDKRHPDLGYEQPDVRRSGEDGSERQLLRLGPGRDRHQRRRRDLCQRQLRGQLRHDHQSQLQGSEPGGGPKQGAGFLSPLCALSAEQGVRERWRHDHGGHETGSSRQFRRQQWPHLHVGTCTRGTEGFLRSLPMTFSKIKNGQGSVVSGVPVDGEFYS